MEEYFYIGEYSKNLYSIIEHYDLQEEYINKQQYYLIDKEKIYLYLYDNKFYIRNNRYLDENLYDISLNLTEFKDLNKLRIFKISEKNINKINKKEITKKEIRILINYINEKIIKKYNKDIDRYKHIFKADYLLQNNKYLCDLTYEDIDRYNYIYKEDYLLPYNKYICDLTYKDIDFKNIPKNIQENIDNKLNLFFKELKIIDIEDIKENVNIINYYIHIIFNNDIKKTEEFKIINEIIFYDKEEEKYYYNDDLFDIYINEEKNIVKIGKTILGNIIYMKYTNEENYMNNDINNSYDFTFLNEYEYTNFIKDDNFRYDNLKLKNNEINLNKNKLERVVYENQYINSYNYLNNFCIRTNTLNDEHYLKKYKTLDDEYSLLSYNIHNFVKSCNSLENYNGEIKYNDDNDNNEEIISYNKIKNMINIINPDIIGFQEYSPLLLENDKVLNFWEEDFNKEYIYEINNCDCNNYKKKYLCNSLTLSINKRIKTKLIKGILEPIYYNFYKNMEFKKYNMKTKRPYIISKININGKKLYIINIHPISIKNAQYLSEINNLSKYLFKLNENNKNFILFGDFNSKYFVIENNFEKNKLHLINILNLLDPEADKKFSSYYGLGMIDHILVSDHFFYDFIPISINILKVNYSDHLPVLFKFKPRTNDNINNYLNYDGFIKYYSQIINVRYNDDIYINLCKNINSNEYIQKNNEKKNLEIELTKLIELKKKKIEIENSIENLDKNDEIKEIKEIDEKINRITQHINEINKYITPILTDLNNKKKEIKDNILKIFENVRIGYIYYVLKKFLSIIYKSHPENINYYKDFNEDNYDKINFNNTYNNTLKSLILKDIYIAHGISDWLNPHKYYNNDKYIFENYINEGETINKPFELDENNEIIASSFNILGNITESYHPFYYKSINKRFYLFKIKNKLKVLNLYSSTEIKKTGMRIFFYKYILIFCKFFFKNINNLLDLDFKLNKYNILSNLVGLTAKLLQIIFVPFYMLIDNGNKNHFSNEIFYGILINDVMNSLNKDLNIYSNYFNNYKGILHNLELYIPYPIKFLSFDYVYYNSKIYSINDWLKNYNNLYINQYNIIFEKIKYKNEIEHKNLNYLKSYYNSLSKRGLLKTNFIDYYESCKDIIFLNYYIFKYKDIFLNNSNLISNILNLINNFSSFNLLLNVENQIVEYNKYIIDLFINLHFNTLNNVNYDTYLLPDYFKNLPSNYIIIKNNQPYLNFPTSIYTSQNIITHNNKNILSNNLFSNYDVYNNLYKNLQKIDYLEECFSILFENPLIILFDIINLSYIQHSTDINSKKIIDNLIRYCIKIFSKNYQYFYKYCFYLIFFLSNYNQTYPYLCNYLLSQNQFILQEIKKLVFYYLLIYFKSSNIKLYDKYIQFFDKNNQLNNSIQDNFISLQLNSSQSINDDFNTNLYYSDNLLPQSKIIYITKLIKPFNIFKLHYIKKYFINSKLINFLINK